MKSAHIVAALSIGSLLAACNSLDNPLSNLPNLGRDARVYNSNTNSYEWPDDAAERKKEKERKAQLAAAMKAATPTPTPTAKATAVTATTATATSKNRPYDPNRGVSFVKTTPTPENPKFTPFPVAVRITPVPAPKNGTGYFNPETGKIEWTTDGRPPKKAAATPKPKATPAPASKFSTDPALAPGAMPPGTRPPSNNPPPAGNGAPLFPQ